MAEDNFREPMEDKKCKVCEIVLSKEIRAGKRLMCRPCRSKQTMEWVANNRDRRNKTVNAWTRKIGRVKEYPCEICTKPCYKKYAKAFCSDKCRFFSHVEVTKSCWLWKGSTDKRGYGKTCFRGNEQMRAHRMSYELFKVPVPEGILVLHRCDIPSCVNPGHLFTGTTQDNKLDQLVKDRGGVKLKGTDVIDIRKLHSEGMGSQAIAYLYKVTCGTISSIIKRRIWKHV
jgi:hypothetical protein